MFEIQDLKNKLIRKKMKYGGNSKKKRQHIEIQTIVSMKDMGKN